MNKLKKSVTLLLALALCMSLSGCFLLPEEATVPALPLVTPYNGAEYMTAEVTRGDLTLTREISCAFSATKKQDLKFTVADKPYGRILVEAGDLVKAGDLVAQLDTTAVETRLEQADAVIARLEIQLAAAKEALQLALEAEALRGDGSTLSSAARTADLEYFRASLDIQQRKRAELAQELESLRLYATIDGTVTYAKRLTEGLKSSKVDVVVTVTDTTSSVFTARTDLYALFPDGAAYTVVCDGMDYPCLAASAASLGLPDTVDQQGNRTICLVVQGPETPTSGNARGTVTLMLDSREDVLTLPRRAVFTVGERSYVYYEEDSGLKSAREVVCGLTAGRMVEITQGLSEGDRVILS